jgi:hypothetical protein
MIKDARNTSRVDNLIFSPGKFVRLILSEINRELFSNNKITIDVIIMVNFNHGREMEQGMDCFVWCYLQVRAKSSICFKRNFLVDIVEDCLSSSRGYKNPAFYGHC